MRKGLFQKLFEPELEEIDLNIFTWSIEEEISTINIYHKIYYNNLDDEKTILIH